MRLKDQSPVFAMLFTQLIYTGMFLLSKASMSSGMKPYVFVAYRQAIAALLLAPLAYFYERKPSSFLTWRLLVRIYISSIFGLHASMNLTYLAFKFVSATYSNAISNIVPALVFAMAVPLKMEKLCVGERQGQAKVLGLVLCISGALVFSLYHGPSLYPTSQDQRYGFIARRSDTIKGCLFALAAQLAWAIWLLMQKGILDEYSGNLRVTVLECGFGSVTTAICGVAVDREVCSWRLQWDRNLLTVLYCGIAVTGVTYTLQNWVVAKRGPVYAAIFYPLSLVLTAILSAVFLHDALYWGSVVGGVLLVGGLYSFVWAKNLETHREIPCDV